ncbi:TIGR02300 family protein [Psychromarinibacter sp. C21-152]|uniref:TIGR02300 family protein n=1 Tax=Psychromarinibacter sediminicola TaxID=3033385 RepID=A0AAE3NRR4_9RHOB|nr:TIGR02300 family protein [Psychromarinibacter sediminicola]MDF0602308.1 TIGR02300 family protein [Psychromarinibacter sediminicola]
MPKEEWGTKRVCPTTGKRFYDLNRNPIVSPYTGEVVNIDSGGKTRAAIADKAEKQEESTEDSNVDLQADDSSEVDLDDDILDDEDDDDNVSLDDIADVSTDDDES